MLLFPDYAWTILTVSVCLVVGNLESVRRRASLAVVVIVWLLTLCWTSTLRCVRLAVFSWIVFRLRGLIGNVACNVVIVRDSFR